jgi:rare lipoprotein A
MLRRTITGVIQMKLILASLVAALVFAAPAQALTTGWASFYKSGRLTANGEHFKPMGLTCAHRRLAFGTKLKVTNLKTGKSVLVRVNDRGPFIRGRILDLSLGAAKVIGLNRSGVAKISFVVVR